MKRLLPPARFWLPVVALFFSLSLQAQTIIGSIADENGQPMASVSITEKGTPNSVASKADGSYTISVKSPRAVVVFTFVGYTSREINAGDAAIKKVVLSTDDKKSLDQVVVVGYGTQRRKDLTGSVASIGAKDIEKLPVAGVDQALQGQVPGLQINTTSGAPGGNTTILLRGVSSITGGIEPLVVIDGFRLRLRVWAIRWQPSTRPISKV